MEYKKSLLIDRYEEYEKVESSNNNKCFILNELIKNKLPYDILQSCEETSTTFLELYSSADPSFLDQLNYLQEYPIENQKIAEIIIQKEIPYSLQEILESYSSDDHLFDVYSNPNILIQSLLSLIFFTKNSDLIHSHCSSELHIIDSLLDYYEQYPPLAQKYALDLLSILYWDSEDPQLFSRVNDLISLLLPIITEINGDAMYLLPYEILKNISAFLFKLFAASLTNESSKKLSTEIRLILLFKAYRISS